ncbi:enoyl-CoA hydratase-related protein [Saprospiraceae bacterium]|jgi:2-(1,2-epoxy-1,2-dihydrophenyl)acetyl-CoA isomerase|nr:enoyl-CoA hydratase-related protein [Saprospiraceae bacterium]HCV50152.1 2-(1,2-epoxy-1,2-dihydrophenyl)acetyl-CoA isomerase [Saprospirales bacterium]MDA9358287.1 enoyl-CoA hydratase-related protein [Saprospiraceae bacterium]MDA9866338.1 enoyl-CoA hydratase-related protein [Saprospiraceae bacterium]MDB4162986.1 enoyl-CoA hydratase-related protein [Saprospiraceae bacterium]
MSVLITEIDNGVLYITLNRPDKYNSGTQEMAFAFHKALDKARDNDDVRAVYITGAGKAFCAGQDLGEIVDPNGLELPSMVKDHYNPTVERIRNLNKPVVAAVNGVAAGAGANIALACDVVVASEGASFIQAFSKIGLIPDSGGTYTLPRLIGLQRASALMMLGDKVSAADALQMGMLYKVFPIDTFVEESRKIVQKLAKMPTKALGMTKILLNESIKNSLKQQLELEGRYQELASHTEDYKEGVDAFLEKRKPTFKGK